jgi:hypothetical protein
LIFGLCRKLRDSCDLPSDSQKGNREQQRLKNLCRLIPDLTGIRKSPDFKIDFEVAIQEAYVGFLKTLPAFLRGIDLDNIAADVLRSRVVRRFNKTIQNQVADQYRRPKQQPFTFSLDAPTKSKKGE